MKTIFGLVGKHLTHSWSAKYFTKKFQNLNLPDYSYELWEFNDVHLIRTTLNRIKGIKGFNVTIPFKISIIQELDHLSEEAIQIQAVNTILIKNNLWIGYNTDVDGFVRSIQNWIPQPYPNQALIFGNGGAARAVAYGCQKMGIQPMICSRNDGDHVIQYSEMKKDPWKESKLWINTTPVGMWPHIDQVLSVPFELLTKQHYVFDCIYNPEQTLFLKHAYQHTEHIKNGLDMLENQAEKSWEIWNSLI